MKLPEHFKSHIQSKHLFTKNDYLIIAVSGGIDSVVLCELCHQAGYNFCIAHCNFQLRAQESDRDETFVRSLGVRYSVESKVIHFDTETIAGQRKISIQEAARELRYTWFSGLVSIASANAIKDQQVYVLTAHHADDNAETLLMHFCRGTGLTGLTGIPVTNDFIRRPLLAFTKQQLVDYAAENQLKYVEDISNLSVKYTRNLFRLEVLPSIEKVFPQVRKNLNENINRFIEINRIYQDAINQFRKKLCLVKGKEIHIPVLQLMKLDNRALIYELIYPYGFREGQVEELIKLAGSTSGKFVESPSGNFRIIRHRRWFIISPLSVEESTHFIMEENKLELQFPPGLLQWSTIAIPVDKIVNPKQSTSDNTIIIDQSAIQFPLLLRPWKTGDYFYPLGMKKKKKLGRFLIDQRLSKSEKERIWVITTDQKIIWVLGRRMDDRFKITSQTKQMLKITFQPGQ